MAVAIHRSPVMHDASLDDLDGPAGVATVSGDVELTDDAALCEDVAQGWVDDLGSGLSGTATVERNDGACP
jgi:hypothetical protein